MPLAHPAGLEEGWKVLALLAQPQAFAGSVLSHTSCELVFLLIWFSYLELVRLEIVFGLGFGFWLDFYLGFGKTRQVVFGI